MKNLNEWLEDIEGRHPTAIDLGLDRIKTVAARLKLLDWVVPTVVVGGTNGKGSTVAMLESLAHACGLRIASYTSPHLFHFNERIKIDGQTLSDSLLCEGLEAVESARCQSPVVSLTYFEMTTLLALHLFQQRQPNLDFIVLEIGLGGRLDAVNIVDADVSIITSIGFDHQAYLGDTLSAIGLEKVAIARSGKPLVLAEAEIPVEVNQEAARLGALTLQLGKDYQLNESSESWSISNATINFAALPRPGIKLSNAAAALVAFDHLLPKKLNEKSAIQACKLTQPVGRFSVLEAWPNIRFDVAHNPAACELLAKRVEQLNTKGEVYGLCGFLADKAVTECLAPLKELVSHWYCAPLATERSLSSSDLAAQIGGKAHLFESIEQAFKAALEVLGPQDTLIVFGSFYTVSEVQELLSNSNE